MEPAMVAKTNAKAKGVNILWAGLPAVVLNVKEFRNLTRQIVLSVGVQGSA
jgi:hypothetical protein